MAKSSNPHILMISPPLSVEAQWFAPHTPYSIAKFGMSLVVLGLHKELEPKGIAVNALWPRTMICEFFFDTLIFTRSIACVFT